MLLLWTCRRSKRRVPHRCCKRARTDLKDEMGRTPLDVAHDNLRVEYRPALQNHKPEDVQATIDLLEKLSQR